MISKHVSAYVIAALFLAIGQSSVAQDHAPAPAVDARKAIVLTDAERALILTEMRQFLSAVQTITTALADEDFERAAQAAKKMGLAAAGGVPAATTAKLPVEFRRLGQSTHAGFDRIALDAGELGDAQHSLEQLGTVLGNCVACHATFRFESEQPKH